ncbi:MAG: hypothetical protein EHM77_06255 [Planctomycetaceae bacterium]|nr:MAG: hypothetical protein EHM77_06255 [Planctomycetaceae bacterium]
MSALDSNFNPSKSNIEMRQKLGYPRLLSGDMTNLGTTLPPQLPTLYPEDKTFTNYTDLNQRKKYYLNLPFYPFRTLSPRDVAMYSNKTSNATFDYASPLFPAHTQFNFVLKRRKLENMLDYMLPFNLDPSLGHSLAKLNDDQRKIALTFNVGTGAAQTTHVITKVEIQLHNLYLQVIRLKYRNISPERPLSNIFTSYRTIFTPVQKVSLHSYNLSWETAVRPHAVYIGFVKEADIQHLEDNKVFHTPGIYYRPAYLKTMRVYLGNTDSSNIFENFNLENLNNNGLDYTHHNYEKYLQHKYFLPEGEKNYFEHTRKNIIPTPISGVLGKGLFNIFPLSLDSDILTHSPSSNLGVISTSALRLELELEPVPQTVTWYLFYTFVYLNKITFQGSTVKQDVTVEYLK